MQRTYIRLKILNIWKPQNHTIAPLSAPNEDVKGSGKYNLENDGTLLSNSKEDLYSASLHRGTSSKLTTYSTLSIGDQP